ncbi:LacI family DNA-binding transcriptional regulator [Curtobacterium sp. 9128]|uniref:LacI family DNA-binding transcriptional regulator n=1 Tax=Curtobacterium sp. 9128 TaxID=1793722 RepID=UPI0011A7AE48|nr:LacI family DNA-binding transcriptional regulator [Curtobacterium sp. 9128]
MASTELSRASIKDVAREAGVSTATVSRVLTGARAVREESVQAVTDAVQKLGYRPNQLGRALRLQSTATVGMVVPRVDNPFFPAIIQRVEQQLHDAGFEMLLCTSNDDPDLESEKVRTLLGRQVDALLISACDAVKSGPILQEASRRVPVVQIDQVTADWEGDFVGVDDDGGIRAIVEHLRGSGRRRLAYIGSGDENSSGAARSRAFRALVPGAPMRLGAFNAQWGETAAIDLLDGDHPPDAIVCGNDMIALGALRACEARSVRVPDEVSVTGFDDVELAAVLRPALTTVRQPVQGLVDEAVRLIVERTTGVSRPGVRVTLQTELVQRQSA